MNINEKIESKKMEIEKYQILLNNYKGRWWDQSKRYLETLKEELKKLEDEYEATRSDKDTVSKD